METNITTPTVQAVATAPVTPTAPVAAAPIAAEVPLVANNAAANTSMAYGGETSSSGGGVKAFFQSLNWLEIGFSILGVATLSSVIYYYKYKLKQDKMINNELQRQIDEIKMNMQTAPKAKAKTI
jgi:hypothetical protein